MILVKHNVPDKVGFTNNAVQSGIPMSNRQRLKLRNMDLPHGESESSDGTPLPFITGASGVASLQGSPTEVGGS